MSFTLVDKAIDITLVAIKLKGFTVQRNRVLSEDDFEQVVLVPSGVEPVALDTYFQRSLVFQEVVSDLAQGIDVLWPVILAHSALVFPTSLGPRSGSAGWPRHAIGQRSYADGSLLTGPSKGPPGRLPVDSDCLAGQQFCDGPGPGHAAILQLHWVQSGEDITEADRPTHRNDRESLPWALVPYPPAATTFMRIMAR